MTSLKSRISSSRDVTSSYFATPFVTRKLRYVETSPSASQHLPGDDSWKDRRRIFGKKSKRALNHEEVPRGMVGDGTVTGWRSPLKLQPTERNGHRKYLQNSLVPGRTLYRLVPAESKWSIILLFRYFGEFAFIVKEI